MNDRLSSYCKEAGACTLCRDAGLIHREDDGRWRIEVLLHEVRESFGLGQDRCRRYRRIVAVNAFRLVVGAAEVLFFAEQVAQAEVMDLRRYCTW